MGLIMAELVFLEKSVFNFNHIDPKNLERKEELEKLYAFSQTLVLFDLISFHGNEISLLLLHLKKFLQSHQKNEGGFSIS